jgi:hypothetical protein
VVLAGENIFDTGLNGLNLSLIVIAVIVLSLSPGCVSTILRVALVVLVSFTRICGGVAPTTAVMAGTRGLVASTRTTTALSQATVAAMRSSSARSRAPTTTMRTGTALGRAALTTMRSSPARS